MKENLFDVIIVGAGYAGLSASYFLKKYGLTHVVFERGKVGESWRSQRWDSFRLNSLNKLNTLPGLTCEPNKSDVFASSPEFVSSLEDYVATFQLPVVEDSKVMAIEKPAEHFHVTVLSNGSIKNYFSGQVIIASGVANEIKIPSFARNIAQDIMQLHTSEYRNADQLPAGAVIVVGSAQSGCQIAEDLADAGRTVYLSTSMVARLPRWYRGRDCMDWLNDLKFFDMRAEDIEDPKMLEMRPPQITGTGDGRRTISLQLLAKKGITILGKIDTADEQNIFLQPNAALHVKFADEFSKKVKAMIDDFIEKNKLEAPAPQIDEADIPDVEASCASAITSLNMKEKKVSSVIWSTGFNADFSYIKLAVFNSEGSLLHRNGIFDINGLYLLGFPWQRYRKSAILFGMRDDAEFIADKVYNYSKTKPLAESV